MLSKLNSTFRRYRSDEDGVLTPEALVFMVALIWAYTGMFIFWDAYKTENLVVKASFTVADMISRQTEIDAAYVEGANDIFGFLSGSDPTNDLRVTIVEMDDDGAGNPEATVKCSYATGALWTPITDAATIEDQIPITAIGDELIVVEGLTSWEPTFNIGLPGRTLYEMAISKPRYAGSIDCSGFVTPTPAT